MFFIDVICNCIESLLFFNLLRTAVGYEKGYEAYAKTCWIIIAGFTTLSNYFEINATLSYCISTAIEFAYGSLFFDHKKDIRYLYSSSLLVFSTLSNYVTVFIASAIYSGNVTSVWNSGTYRLEIVSLYTLLLTLCFFLATLLKPKEALFKRWHIISLFLMLLTNACCVIVMLYFTLQNADNIDSVFPLGVISLLLLFMTFVIISVFYKLAVTNKKYYDEQIELISLRSEKNHFEQVQGTYEYLRRSKHDTNIHLRTIRGMTGTSCESEVIAEYINELLNEYPDSEFGLYTGNAAVDAVISESALTASKYNIDFQTIVICPEKLPMPDFEFCSVIGNLLDNALEACNKTKDNRYIKLQIDFNDANLRVLVKNSSNGQYRTGENSLVTDKENSQYHGIGIKRIKELVSKHGGMCSFSPQSACFESIIYLPI